MKKLILILLLGGFALTSCQKDDLSSVTELNAVEGRGKAKTEENKKADASMKWDVCDAITGDYAELYAGQHELVGKVTVKEEGDFYVIRYEMDAGFCLSETHLEVVGDPDDFPLSGGGNPPPGQFTYKGDHDCDSEAEYRVPTANFVGPIYIAAHAVVKCVELYLPELPKEAVFTINELGEFGAETYFDVTVLPDNILSGSDYNGWCVDVTKPIPAPPDASNVDSYVYSSMDFPDDLVANPNNMEEVIWLLNNQQFIDQTNPDTECDDNPDYVPGPYNFGDYQNAIWLLLNGRGTGTGQNLGDYDATLCRAGELAEKAMTAIDGGWKPECGDYAGVILVPKNGWQPIIIPIPIECKEGCSETAWARNSKDVGCEFPGNNWATYFKFGE